MCRKQPLAFDDLAAKTFGDIVASAGYSRRKLLERMNRSSNFQTEGLYNYKLIILAYTINSCWICWFAKRTQLLDAV